MRMDRRVRALGWFIRRTASIAGMSDADIVTAQGRAPQHNPVLDRIFGGLLPGVETADRTIDGPEAPVRVRVYRPRTGSGRSSEKGPLVVNYHGGGFVFGTLGQSDWICSSVASAVGAVVVSVDYRLAPSHPFPAAAEDSYAALVWAAGNAAELGAGDRLGVMGESAGGNLAAVVSLLARDRGGPRIHHQALLYPATDMSGTPSGAPDTPILSPAEMSTFRRHYLGDGDGRDPRASPLLAEDHHGLPPALIQVAEHDPLRTDGLRYAATLREADVPVRLTEYVGMPHGYLNFPGVCRSAPQAMAELCAEQRAALVPQAQPAGESRSASPTRR
jgi:acetyl esterase